MTENKTKGQVYKNNVMAYFCAHDRGKISDIKRFNNDNSKGNDKEYRLVLEEWIKQKFLSINRGVYTARKKINSNFIKEMSKEIADKKITNVPDGVNMVLGKYESPEEITKELDKDSELNDLFLKGFIKPLLKGRTNDAVKKKLCSLVDEIRPPKYKKIPKK